MLGSDPLVDTNFVPYFCPFMSKSEGNVSPIDRFVQKPQCYSLVVYTVCTFLQHRLYQRGEQSTTVVAKGNVMVASKIENSIKNKITDRLNI